MGLPPYLVYQAGARQETDGLLKTAHARELNEGTIYKRFGGDREPTRDGEAPWDQQHWEPFPLLIMKG